MQPCDLSIKEASTAIATGKLSSVQLVTSCLERIAKLEEKIQAWALVDRDGALETAKRLDRELSQGQKRGLLHGIPMGIKDIFYVAGLPTEAGSRALSGFVPSYDAETITRLKNAGAIILGKTRTTEFAYRDPTLTRNPWNTAHTPGGSSSGSGAAVASGMCLAALGSQTIGSTLRPAAYNGIVGLKAQNGRISTYGVVPVSWTLDHVGVLARNTEDAAIVFQAIAGHDPKDLNSINGHVPDCLSQLETAVTPCLGLIRQFFFDQADEEMRQHTEMVAERLHHSGAKIDEVTLPASFAAADGNAMVIMAAEAATYHQEMFTARKDQYGPNIRELVENGLAIKVTEYINALRARLQLRADIQELFTHFDALVTPAAPGAAPGTLKTTGSAIMQRAWSVTGQPAISIPTGLNKDGMPLAIQLVGPAMREDKLLAIARWCERTLGVHLRPPLD